MTTLDPVRSNIWARISNLFPTGSDASAGEAGNLVISIPLQSGDVCWVSVRLAHDVTAQLFLADDALRDNDILENIRETVSLHMQAAKKDGRIRKNDFDPIVINVEREVFDRRQ